MLTDGLHSPRFTDDTMHSFLEWFRLEEFFPIVMISLLLVFISQQIMGPDSETYRRARYCTSAVFFLYAGMGIYAFVPASVTELLIIVVRALLASGFAYGLSLVTLGPAAFLIGRVRALTRSKAKPAPVEPPRPTTQPATKPRDLAAEQRVEKERMNKIDDAKSLTSEFYEEHAEVLKESLPAALFKTQMRTKFPDTISPDQAWQAAQGMIAEMIPFISKSREQQRAEEEETRKRDEQASEEAMKLDDAAKRTVTMERLIEWKKAEEARLKENLPPGNELEVHLINLAQRFDDLMKTTIDEAQP